MASNSWSWKPGIFQKQNVGGSLDWPPIVWLFSDFTHRPVRVKLFWPGFWQSFVLIAERWQIRSWESCWQNFRIWQSRNITASSAPSSTTSTTQTPYLQLWFYLRWVKWSNKQYLNSTKFTQSEQIVSLHQIYHVDQNPIYILTQSNLRIDLNQPTCSSPSVISFSVFIDQMTQSQGAGCTSYF